MIRRIQWPLVFIVFLCGCIPNAKVAAIQAEKLEAKLDVLSKKVEQTTTIAGEGNRTKINDPSIMYGVLAVLTVLIGTFGVMVKSQAKYSRERLAIYRDKGNMASKEKNDEASS